MNADQLFQFLQKLPLDERGSFDIQCGCDDGQVLTEVKYACSLQEAIGKEFWFVFHSRNARRWSIVTFNGKLIASAFWHGDGENRWPRFFIFKSFERT